MELSRIFSVLLILTFFLYVGNAQIDAASAQKKINPADTIPISLAEKRFQEQYNKNIRKTRINGVYIPKDLPDAFNELQALAQKESIDKFKNANAEFVVNRLHYGLGRWIILNWNFYEGSRISHHIKSYGITHPDDQARFLLLTFHNHLNGKELMINQIAEKLLVERAQDLEKRKSAQLQN